MADGIINVYKEKGYTSHDVVAKMRGILKQKKIGHTGTLDPMAEGVLPVCLGNGTKLCDLLADRTKTYRAVLLLGLETDTQDTTGVTLAEYPVAVTEEEVKAAVLSFLGDYDQVPPMYSALKVDGKKLYELARRGKEVERKPRSITIHELELLEGEGTEYVLRVRCSKGTYVRTLCHDLGSALGCGGCMSSLRRTRAGSFTLSQAVTMQQVLDFAAEHDPQELLMPVDAVFSVHPPLIVTLGQAAKLKNGAQVRDWQFRSGTYRVYAEDGEFLLLGRVENGLLTTIKSFFEVNTLAT